MELQIRSAASYANGLPIYNRPIEIGCFSVNSDGKYCEDRHQVKYLSMPDKLTDLNFDLNEGYSDYVHIHEDSEDRFETILRWIVSHEDLIRKHFTDSSFLSNSKPDFVVLRGVLTSVASTVYEKSGDWRIYATKFRSVIYMNIVKIELKSQWLEDLGEKGERMPTWGFKFEQYMTSKTVNSRPNTSVPVNENEKYYSVSKSKLNNHRILLLAEIDGVDPEHFRQIGHDPTSVLRYVELKTSRLMTTEKQEWNFRRYKLIKWYLQSCFGGVPRVICGFRDDDGIVRELVNYDVQDMPKMADGAWSSTSCLNFCSHFLSFLKRCGMKDDPRVTYRIYRKPDSSIICEELPSEFQLLPDWYIEKVKTI